MLAKIRKEIKQDYYRQNFSNNGQRFVAWYVHNVHRRDMMETKEDVTDGPDDKQIDAMIVDDEANTVYVIQGKFVPMKNVDAEPLREVLSSWAQLKDIVGLQETGNQKLKRRLTEVGTALDDDYNIAFELLITGQLTESASNDLARFQEILAEDNEFPAELHVVDSEELQRRYDLALQQDNPLISHQLQLDSGKYMAMEIGGTNCVIAAVPLKDCITFPGIKDGTLFQKNVRQSLGLNNRVNKGIKTSIYGSSPTDFFFYHNGITAICNSLSISDGRLTARGLSVVNGCQSLNTILSCSEKVKELEDTFVMMRFYEITEPTRADSISISTNSQSAVKPRDLRSNDKRVISLKRSYEDAYTQGYFITKRGEEAPADKDKALVVDLLELGKHLIAWHSQRPNISYSENKIFDKHFAQLFNRDYQPESVHALAQWMRALKEYWAKDNPLGLNESLLAMQAYAPYHHLYAISLCFCVANNMGQGVPDPVTAYNKAKSANLINDIAVIGGTCLNSALEAAANEQQPQNRVFSPQNWIKTTACLAGIRLAINQYFNLLPSLPGGIKQSQKLRGALQMETSEFHERWAAD